MVSAAASLKEAFDACSREFDAADVRLSFAGSDELAAQIRQGVKPDVFAAANTELPDELCGEGLRREAVVFATNRSCSRVPGRRARHRARSRTSRARRELAIGAESVPVGSYTREVLGRLPAGEREAILANVRSEEPDVKGVVGKLTQGAADAGFVYATDVGAGRQADGDRPPPELQPRSPTAPPS